MRGFTTLRDTGGADYGMKAAVEQGLFEGPRLFIAGAPLSQTGGHADHPPPHADPGSTAPAARAWPGPRASPTACRR